MQNQDAAALAWDDVVAVIGQEASDKLMLHMGGENLYVPKRTQESLTYRNYQIYYAYTGENLRDLSRAYHLSTRQIRRIIKMIGAT